MGTATFSISKYGTANQNAPGRLVSSGAHTTTTTVSSLTDGAAGAGTAVSAVAGDLLKIAVSEDMRVQFGGEDATATSGHLLCANTFAFLEISGNGEVRIIDVA